MLMFTASETFRESWQSKSRARKIIFSEIYVGEREIVICDKEVGCIEQP
jgi:hypothetical protein